MEWLEGWELDEKKLVSRHDPFPVITASLCIKSASLRPVTKRAGTGWPRSPTCMGQLWTHTLHRLGSLGPDSELEMRLRVVSWALWMFL